MLFICNFLFSCFSVDMTWKCLIESPTLLTVIRRMATHGLNFAIFFRFPIYSMFAIQYRYRSIIVTHRSLQFHRDHISSQFLFKLLKTDLGFVENHNIVSKAVREQRIKQLPYIRHAINSMFLYTHGKNHLHMRAGMQKAVRAFDEYIQNHLKTLTAEKKWAYVELILMHYAPYFTEMM